MQLRPYQTEGRDFLATRSVALLADEMRVGKTPQAIAACHKVEARSVLVVCPAIARSMWERQFQAWYAALGAQMLPRLHVVTYDGARLHQQDIVARGPYDVCIIDEAHFLKNPEAARTLAVYGAGGVARAARRVWALTGTPITNHIGEAWTLLRIAGVVKCTYWEFLRAYCVLAEGGRVVGTRMSKADELRGLFAQLMLRRKRVDVAPELGAIDFNFLPLDAELDHYTYPHPNWLGRQPAAWLEEKRGQYSILRSELALAKAKPLAAHIINDWDSIRHKTVVFAYHRDAITTVETELRAAGIRAQQLTGSTPDRQRQELIAGFQTGKVEVVVAQLLAAGTAIDLSAADHGYFLELDWVPANNAQAAARLVALGKKTPVSYDIATVAGTVDEAIQATLARKTREITTIFGDKPQ